MCRRLESCPRIALPLAFMGHARHVPSMCVGERKTSHVSFLSVSSDLFARHCTSFVSFRLASMSLRCNSRPRCARARARPSRTRWCASGCRSTDKRKRRALAGCSTRGRCTTTKRYAAGLCSGERDFRSETKGSMTSGERVIV